MFAGSHADRAAGSLHVRQVVAILLHVWLLCVSRARTTVRVRRFSYLGGQLLALMLASASAALGQGAGQSAPNQQSPNDEARTPATAPEAPSPSRQEPTEGRAPSAPTPDEPPPPTERAPSPESVPDAASPEKSASEGDSPDGAEIILPRVISRVDARYPEMMLEQRRAARVELLVVVDAAGKVGEVTVAQSAGQEFDAAALAAVRAWRFEPARRAGQAVVSRIRVPFEFTPPAVESAPSPAAPSAPNKKTTAAPSPAQDDSSTPSERDAAEPSAGGRHDAVDAHDHAHDAIEVEVHGRRKPRTDHRSASDVRIGRDVIAAAPRQEGAEVLRSAPGMYIARAEGPAVAHSYMLRGFDAEHGQDIEFDVGGLPINMPSHVHGQGYADLSFLIAETVSEVNVKEGVSDPRQGDFAVAGSVDVALGVEPARRGVHLKTGLGAFGTTRQLAMWAPPSEPDATLGAVQLLETRGFGENRAGSSGSGVVQHQFGEGDQTYRAIAIVHAARSDLAGVLRRDDVDAGDVCFECVYDLPTARAQNAASGRVLAGIFSESTYVDRDNSSLGLWLGLDNFRSQQNYTGFIEQSRTLAGVAGRGDLIEQRNRTLSLGVTGRYRSPRARPAEWFHGTFELGAEGRVDEIEQSQNLIEAGRNETWDRRVDANVLGMNLGLWGDLDWVLSRYAHLRFGMRADVLSYAVEDRLGNFIELSRPQDSFIPGFRRSALGFAWGPRTSVEVHPIEAVSLLLSYGEGYRSPQARQLDDGEQAPFSKVRSADVGVHFDWQERLHVAVAGYYTRLSDDVAFDAEEGRLERIGATQRLGTMLHGYAKPWPWFVTSLSLTYVRASLLEPPPPTTDEPQPPFEEGQALPFVPPIVVRGDVGARRTLLADVAGQPMGAHAGAGFSYLSPRPLPYGDAAAPVTLLDTALGVWWGPGELTFEVFNALGNQYAASEFSFASDWDPDNGVRSRTPARHFAAGAPLSWMVSLGVTL